jgi:ribosomal protein S18 acetylase RimI-like enzyme
VNIAIRTATAADAARVAQIYVDSWNAGFGDLMPPQVLEDDRIDRWAATLTTAASAASAASADSQPAATSARTRTGPRVATTPRVARWWVAARCGAIAGFVGIGPSRDPVDPELGELDTIAVDPAHWRSGVGTALMRTALGALDDDGYREAILWTLADYDRGQRFYLSTGWTPDGGTRDNGHQVSFRHRLRDTSR